MPQLALFIANCLYVIGYGVRDVLLLRAISITAMLTIMPYYLWNGTQVAVEPICWNFVFIAIHSWWVAKIVLERRPPRLTPDQRKLYEFAFHHNCTPRQMLQLLKAAKWKQAESGELLVGRGVQVDRLIVIHEGSASVSINGKEQAHLRDGDLVGEMSFLTRQPVIADVIAKGPLKYVAFDRTALEQLFDQRMELKVAIQGIIGQNLVDRLTKSLVSVPELSVNLQRTV